jgi:hypothetical protein
MIQSFLLLTRIPPGVFSFYCAVAIVIGFSSVGLFRVPHAPILHFIAYALLAASSILDILFRVIVIRSVTSSRRLRISQPFRAYKILLYNSFERKNPFRLLLIPGLLLGYSLRYLDNMALSMLNQRLIMQATQVERPFSLQNIGLALFSSIVYGLLATPAEVIVSKLALQERRPPDLLAQSAPGRTTEAAVPVPASPEGDNMPNYQDSEGIEYAGFEEDVISLRIDQGPYRGLIDCVRSITREEGLKTLWRGWIIVAGFMLLYKLAFLTYLHAAGRF